MGGPDQLAKDLFAEEIPALFGDAVVWMAGVELSFVEMHLDGILSILDSAPLSASPAPWSLIDAPLIVVELKMPGDHLDWGALQRALLRRQALQTGQAEREPPDDRWVGLWMVTPHVPAWLAERYSLTLLAPGCWSLTGLSFPAIWVAANELPLDDALVPLLIARSGKKLVEFVDWSLDRKPEEWLNRVLRWVSMTPKQIAEMREKMQDISPPGWDDAAEARHQELMQDIRQYKARQQRARELADYEAGALHEARKALTQVMTLRGLSMTPDQQAQIEACNDRSLLERWLAQAVIAVSAADALR